MGPASGAAADALRRACTRSSCRRAPAATARLRNFVEKAAQATLVGDVFDDAATGQGLLNFFLRGLSSGALTRTRPARPGSRSRSCRGDRFSRSSNHGAPAPVRYARDQPPHVRPRGRRGPRSPAADRRPGRTPSTTVAVAARLAARRAGAVPALRRQHVHRSRVGRRREETRRSSRRPARCAAVGARPRAPAGFRAMILTAKHHDGFCLWPTQTTTHSVATSPWRGGRATSCASSSTPAAPRGCAPGLYLSPWDRNNPRLRRLAALQRSLLPISSPSC